MLTLILETSTEKGMILLSKKGKPIDTCPLIGGPSLSRTLALEVKTMLNGQVPEAISVGIGPGSYTGIRVGVALAKALAYGWNIPLVGFCSLEAFGPAPVLVDARMGGFYALLENEPELIAPTDPRLKNYLEISTPHPEIIRKRIVSEAILQEKEIDAMRLSEISQRLLHEGKTGPLELIYLSSP